MAPLSPAAAAAALSDGKSTFVGKKNRLEACEVVGRAFAGTETTDPEQTVNWLLGPYLPIGEPDRIPLTTFFMSFAVAILAPSGFTLCAHSADGAIQAVCLCSRMRRAPPEMSLVNMWRILGVLMSHGPPAFYKKKDKKALRKKIDPGLMKRANIVGKVMHKMHKTHANGKHIYVNLMAVEPTEQEKGLCSQLMSAVSRAADIEGLPAYLEASGDRNCAIYSHLGYEVVGTYSVGREGDDENWAPFEKFYAMVRPPRAFLITTRMTRITERLAGTFTTRPTSSAGSSPMSVKL